MKNMKIGHWALLAMLVGTLASFSAFGMEMPTLMGMAFAATQALRTFGVLGDGSTLIGFAADGDPEEVLKAIRDVSAQFKSTHYDLAKVKSQIDEMQAKGGKMTDDLRNDFDKRMSDFNTLKARLDELEQKGADVSRQQASHKSWGQQIIEHDGYADFQKAAESGRTSFRIQVKQTVTTALAGQGGAGTGLQNPTYQDNDLVRMPRTALTIEDLLPVINVDSGSVDYAKQTVRNNAAAPVEETLAKPYSDYAWTSDTVAVRTLAHLTKMSRQAVDDANRLVGEVDSEMRYGLALLKEQQYLYGNGTGQNLHGIMPQATAFALASGVTVGDVAFANRVDVLRLAMLNLQLAGAPVDGMVLNPVDWALIELSKDDGGSYLFSRPDNGLSAPNMWGTRIIATPAMLADDFLIGSFSIGATVYRRMGVEVLISTENDKDFENNLATMRAEERVAMAVKRAWAFQKGKFSTALTSLKTTP